MPLAVTIVITIVTADSISHICLLKARLKSRVFLRVCGPVEKRDLPGLWLKPRC